MLEIAEKLYGRHLTFSFDGSQVEKALAAVDIYDERTRNRVTDIIMEQRRRYGYLFVQHI